MYENDDGSFYRGGNERGQHYGDRDYGSDDGGLRWWQEVGQYEALAEDAPADGLYVVTTDAFAAGYEIRGGRVVACAPILRRNLRRWMRLGKRVDNASEASA